MPPNLSPVLTALRYSPLPFLSFTPLRTLFSSAANTPPGQPSVSRYLLRQPFAGAPRECPTPIVFVRTVAAPATTTQAQAKARGTQGEAGSGSSDETWQDWAGMFAERGYTALEVDINPPTDPQPDTSANGSAIANNSQHPTSPLKAMSTLLASQIRLLAIPFPPILISSGRASNDLAQMYVEDNPLSGLVLVTDDADTVSPGTHGLAGRSSVDFTFEPNFPILLLGPPGGRAALEDTRLGRAASRGRGRGGKGVVVDDLVDGVRGDKSRLVVERWMDSCGF